jgi:hypothetical protein
VYRLVAGGCGPFASPPAPRGRTGTLVERGAANKSSIFVGTVSTGQ